MPHALDRYKVSARMVWMIWVGVRCMGLKIAQIRLSFRREEWGRETSVDKSRRLVCEADA
jgi:hypothetical protein